MKALSRRLRQLENTLVPEVETEFTLELAARIEEGRCRAAVARSGEAHPECTSKDLSGLTVEEILLRGRQRARMATIS
jgi:hypothetical protein